MEGKSAIWVTTSRLSNSVVVSDDFLKPHHPETTLTIVLRNAIKMKIPTFVPKSPKICHNLANHLSDDHTSGGWWCYHKVTTPHLYTIFQFLDLCVSSNGGNVVVVSAFMSVKCRNYYCKIVVIWIIKQAE